MEAKNSSEKSTSEGFTNKQKVFACRVCVLAPIICLLSVFFVLLVCMEMMPNQKDGHSDRSACGLLECTVQYNDSSLVASCVEDKQRNSTTGVMDCLEFKVRCISVNPHMETHDRKPITGQSQSGANSSRNEFCLQNSTKFGSTHARLAERGSKFLQRFIATNGTFQRCQLDETKLKADNLKVKTTRCRGAFDDGETEKEKRMKKNTGIFGMVLAVLLCLGLMGFILMFVNTRRTLQVCCNKCYFED